MTSKLPEIVATAWARLVRAENKLMAAIEADLKSAGLPPLDWYDVLLELKREADGMLRPQALEERLLLAQHNVSRLLDRLENKGLVKRQPVESDGRCQAIAITPAGREMQKRMWPIYRSTLQRHLADKLTEKEATQLAGLLQKLMAE